MGDWISGVETVIDSGLGVIESSFSIYTAALLNLYFCIQLTLRPELDTQTVFPAFCLIDGEKV